MRSLRMHCLVLAVVVATAGCARHSPLAPTQSGPAAGPVQVHRTAGVTDAASHLEGVIGPGALYSIDVPDGWNGTLVLYAHGYTGPQLPIALPGGQFPGVRDQCLSRGFAIAATSFSENGFAEAEGVRQVHQLEGLFRDQVGMPTRTFLVGLSLGGLISLDLIETFPGQYAGGLSVSGPVGGTEAEFNYVGDERLLWDLLMPCHLPGSFTEVPALPLPVSDIVSCITANQQAFGAVALVHRAEGFPVAGTNGNQWASSVVQTLGFHWYGFADGVERAHGQMPYDNHDAVYTSSVVPAPTLAWINANIPRYTSTPAARNFLRQHYEPSGALKAPLLTLHAEQDPLVPWGHEALLLDKVTAAGCLDKLVQFHYPYPTYFGHTDAFTSAQIGLALDALVAWVDTGVKPGTPFALAAGQR